MNDTDCDTDLTGIKRGIGIASILFWLIILYCVVYHRSLEFRLLYQPVILFRRRISTMSEINTAALIGFSVLFLYSFSIMIHYKFYEPYMSPECNLKTIYQVILALLVLNSAPIGINLLIVIGLTIGLFINVFLKYFGYWFINFSLNFSHTIFCWYSAQPSSGNTNNNSNPANIPERVVLDVDIEEPSSENSTETGTGTHELAANTLECPVCLENKQIYLKLKCSHSLCIACANTWFIGNQTCPICRNQISQTPTNLALQMTVPNPTETGPLGATSENDNDNDDNSNNLITTVPIIMI